jgi:hypothetical protein
MNSIEAYIQFERGLITEDGQNHEPLDREVPAQVHDGVPRVHREGLFGPATELVVLRTGWS